MTKEELVQIPNCPGIYLITNKVNSKHYIGQALNLHKRLRQHYNTFINKKRFQHILLYRAMNKYGIENFSLEIIWSIEEYESLSRQEIKTLLDSKEIHYIKEYNSYGSTGYNQTKGGDGGILGYKMTSEQIERIRQNSIRSCVNRKEVYAMDLDTREVFHANSILEMSKILNIPHFGISKCINKLQLVTADVNTNKKYIFNTINDFSFESKLTMKEKNKGKFISKYTLEEFTTIVKNLQEDSYKTQQQVAEILGICKKTVANYVKQLKEQGIYLFKTRNPNG